MANSQGAGRGQSENPEYGVLTSVSWELLRPMPRRYLNLYWFTGLAVLALLIWSARVSVDVMIFGGGRVIPATSTKMVQHYEGGIVSDIAVRSGERVDAGDVLLRVSNVNLSAQLGEIRAALQAVSAQIERLNAEAEGRALSFSPSLVAEAPAVVARESQLYRQRKADLVASQNAFKQQLQKNQQEQRELSNQARLLNQNIELMKKEIKLSEDLVAQGALSEVELFRMERSLREMTVEKQRTESQRLAKQNEANRTEQALQERTAEFANKALAERNQLEGKRDALKEQITAAADRADRSEVLAPVSGIVNQVLVTTLGGVVQPGMDLVEIVPEGDKLLVETRILPEDIAFVTLGQLANVRITAYDFALYGSLKGEVVNIGADTLEADDGSQYYLVQVKTEKNTVGFEEQLPILPGMIANVDIITGKRTLFSYISKPIVRAKEKALREQ